MKSKKVNIRKTFFVFYYVLNIHKTSFTMFYFIYYLLGIRNFLI